MSTSNCEDDEIKIKLFGELVLKIDNILSPKTINIWHVPGAFQRIFSAINLIFQHGCKEDFDGNYSLWNWVVGIRVLRPDLWPTFDLKFHDIGISKKELFRYWLEVSLRSYLLKEQLKTLIHDIDRLNDHFNTWAFLCDTKYTDVLLIALEALEKNSQDILATIDSSLMVKYYSKRKFTASSFLPHGQSYTSSNDEIDKNVNTRDEEYMDNRLSYQLSPSRLEVNYGFGILSDAEKNESQNVNCTNGTKDFEIKDSKTIKESSTALQRKNRPKRRITRNSSCGKDDHSVLISSVKENFKEPYSSSSTSTSDSFMRDHSNEIRNHNSEIDIVSPSSFLIEYLASKPNLKERNITKEGDDCSISSNKTITNSFDKYTSDINTNANIFDQSEITDSNKNMSYQNNDISLFSPEISEDSAIKLDNSEFSIQKKPKKHIRSYSDGSKIIISDSNLLESSRKNDLKKIENKSSRKISIKKPFMEDGGHSITPEADGFFPNPQPGQNLLDFLSTSHMYQTGAQLDKENAHFNIAEAVLAAIEQMNYDSIYLKKTTTIPDESEDDFANFRRNLPYRRRPRMRTRVPIISSTSDEEPVTTDYSILDSPPCSDDSSDSDSCCTNNKIDQENDNSYSRSADSQSVNSNDPSSAESVAIALLRHYNANLLPQASDLQWLVTEQDAPQKLLPMPNSVAVSPDDVDGSYFMPLLRGTSDWAPPRPQLVLILHSNTKRTSHLISQKWRCAGCGLKVSEKLSRHFRFCHYLGRYFCTNCHSNKKSNIPARIIHKWDFKKQYVCNFSFELLSRMSGDPLFHVGTLNPKLYKQSIDLHQTHIYRLQLFHARIYIIICSRAEKEKSLLEGVPLHWSSEPHLYSVDDLISVKSGQMVLTIRQLTTSCINHISKCKVCLGQGFICEICRQGNPIFPFQLDAVTQCTKCRGCFHFVCFSPINSCPRCRRRERREKMRTEEEGEKEEQKM